MHACMHARVYVHVCVYVCMHACMHVYMHACICAQEGQLGRGAQKFQTCVKTLKRQNITETERQDTTDTKNRNVCVCVCVCVCLCVYITPAHAPAECFEEHAPAGCLGTAVAAAPTHIHMHIHIHMHLQTLADTKRQHTNRQGAVKERQLLRQLREANRRHTVREQHRREGAMNTRVVVCNVGGVGIGVQQGLQSVQLRHPGHVHERCRCRDRRSGEREQRLTRTLNHRLVYLRLGIIGVRVTA